MATPSKSAGTSHSSGSEAQPGKIATLPGGFRASEAETRAADFANYLRSHDLTETRNDIDRRLAQLNALLFSCYGFGQEWLDEMGSKLRDPLMWLASDLATEIQEKFDDLSGLSTIKPEVGDE